MKTYDTDNLLDMDEQDIHDLADSKFPKVATRLNRLTSRLATLLNEVKEVFPDAEYYSNDGEVLLMVGSSHGDSSGGESPNRKLVIWSGSSKCIIDGGGF